MINIIISVFLLLGGYFALIAAIGVLRLPDVLTRMIYLQETEITVRVIAIILFLMLTSPIGAHMIGRASVRDLQSKKDIIKDNSQ